MANLTATFLLIPLSLLALYQSSSTAQAKRFLSSSSSSIRETDKSEADMPGAPASLRKRSVSDDMAGSRRWRLEDLLRRRRTLEALLRAPPSSDVNYALDDMIQLQLQRLSNHDGSNGRVSKRDDEWIWMPAHGYIPMPKDETVGGEGDNGIGNLLRYG